MSEQRSSAAERVVARLLTFRSQADPKIGMAIGAIATALVVYFITRGSFGLLADLDLGVLAISALVGVPIMVLLNGLELRQVGRIASCELPVASCVQLALFAAAANALPFPGAAIVRIGVLRRAGVKVATATLANVISMGVWAGSVFVAFGALGLVHLGPLAGVLIVIGLAGLATSAVLARRFGPTWLRHWSGLLVLEIAIIAADAARYAAVLVALGGSPTALHALSLSAAGLLTTIIGIVPAGLGVREAIAAFLAAIVDLDSRVAITASAADRVATFIVLGALTVPVLPRLRSLAKELSA